MKLFFKHLFRSIKKRPLQPLILLFTVTLSLIVCAVSIALSGYLNVEAEHEQSARYGRADISIGINANTKSRLMFTKTVKDVLGDDVAVSGCYELPIFLKNRNGAVFGVAVDFNEISDIFDIEFSSYGEVFESTEKTTAFISEEFAISQDLKVGDKFSAKLLGCSAEYTVQGISTTPFMAQYDVMVSVSGVMKMLSETSLTVALLGDDFKPCSTIFINVGDKDLGECINALKASEDFSDKEILEVKDKVVKTINIKALSMISVVIVAVSCVVSAAVTFSCLYILSSERSGENATFYALGAKKRHLYILQYAEIFIYWLVGMIVSNFAVGPILRLIVNSVDFNYVKYSYSILTALKSGGIILLSSMLTVTAFLTLGSKGKKKKSNSMVSIGVAVLAFVMMISLVFIPLGWKLVWSTVCSVLLVTLIVVGAPIVFEKLSKWIDDIFTKRINKKEKIENLSAYYAIKNVKNVKVMHNTARLAVMTVALVVVFAMLMLSVGKTINANGKYLNGEYVVLNANQRCYQNVLEKDSVKDAYQVGVFSFTTNGKEHLMVSVSDVSALNEKLQIEKLPTGNQMFMSKGRARALGVKPGDEVTFTYGDKEYVLEYAESFSTNVYAIIFDCEHFGLERGVMTVTAEGGVSDDELHADVSAAVALEVSTVINTQDYLKSQLRLGRIYYESSKNLFPALMAFVIIGIVDNLIESYRTRKEEFELYRLAGMSKKQVRRVKITELIYTFGVGILLGAIVSLLLLISLDQVLMVFGYDMVSTLK